MGELDNRETISEASQFVPALVEISDRRMWERVLNLEDDYAMTVGMAHRHLTQHHQLYLAHTAGGAIPAASDRSLGPWLLSHLEARDALGDELPPMRGVPGFIAVQFAPQGLSAGAALQNAANTANCHEPVAALLHAVHGQQVGDGRLEKNHSVLYRKLLDHYHIRLPDIHSDRFTASADFFPLAWSLPAYRLSLSLFPEAAFGAILGAALFELALGIPPVLRGQADPLLAQAGYRKTDSQAALNPVLEKMISAIALALELSETPELLSAQITEGFFHSMWLHEEWVRDVRLHLAQGGQGPHDAMVSLVKRKGKFAVGYHSKLKLNNQAFDSLIVSDADAFVSALAGSRWVVPGSPRTSLLLVKLIQFGGPMFRVFSDDEVAVIEAWISSLEPVASTAPAMPAPGLAPVLIPAPAERKRRSRSPACARTLYHQLLNLESHPEAHEDALDYALTWLARSADGVASDANAIPFRTYSHEQLVAWFEQKALEQVKSYGGPGAAIEKTREAVIDEALQLCPMILADGAWLQRWGNAGLAESPIGALLFKILSDEIGNGDTVLNHPNIYRSLMQQMGIELPDFRSVAFAHWERFDDASFSVPAFWLSLSQFPRRFLPETLGLNLSMELSGVGGAYRSARDELRHFGFSTTFVDLHNTIDNVSTGHSAMALEAIQIYMDGIIGLCDSRFVAAQWQRIWVGYRALAAPRQRWRDLIIKPRYLLYPSSASASSARGNN